MFLHFDYDLTKFQATEMCIEDNHRHSVVLLVITFLDSSHGLSNVIRAHAH